MTDNTTISSPDEVDLNQKLILLFSLLSGLTLLALLVGCIVYRHRDKIRLCCKRQCIHHYEDVVEPPRGTRPTPPLVPPRRASATNPTPTTNPTPNESDSDNEWYVDNDPVVVAALACSTSSRPNRQRRTDHGLERENEILLGLMPLNRPPSTIVRNSRPAAAECRPTRVRRHRSQTCSDHPVGFPVARYTHRKASTSSDIGLLPPRHRSTSQTSTESQYLNDNPRHGTGPELRTSRSSENFRPTSTQAHDAGRRFVDVPTGFRHAKNSAGNPETKTSKAASRQAASRRPTSCKQVDASSADRPSHRVKSFPSSQARPVVVVHVYDDTDLQGATAQPRQREPRCDTRPKRDNQTRNDSDLERDNQSRRDTRPKRDSQTRRDSDLERDNQSRRGSNSQSGNHGQRDSRLNRDSQPLLDTQLHQMQASQRDPPNGNDPLVHPSTALPPPMPCRHSRSIHQNHVTIPNTSQKSNPET